MKFDPEKLSKIIEQNYSHLMPDFFEMQTEYLASLNIIYHDLDASLVAMVLTSRLYKQLINESGSEEKVSLKHFYQKNNYKLPINSFKIKEISSLLNLPRETVRRKKEKIIKDRLIILDKKKKMYDFNSEMVDRKVIDAQIENLSKFLSKFSIYFSKNKFFMRAVSKEKIKQDVEDKFLLYLTKFLDFQISYFSKMKSIVDIESVFIILLCALNSTSQLRKKEDPIPVNDIFKRLHSFNDTYGLNATTISEITKVPRTTVLRKISTLEKRGILIKDKHKRYSHDDLTKGVESSKFTSILNYNINLLGIFFADCLETYSGSK